MFPRVLLLCSRRRLCNCHALRRHAVASFSTTIRHALPDDLERQRREILAEASALTRTLYRLCMRSVKLIERGNEADAAEFASREEKQLESFAAVAGDERLSGVISMLPPVEPKAELKARAEYYAQYTNENFFAESDCLKTTTLVGGGDKDDTDNRSIPDETMFARYFFHLRKGEEHRQWLLKDMEFDDPFRFDLERVSRLEARVRELHHTHAAHEWQRMDPQQQQELERMRHDLDTYDSDEEAFSDDDDEEEEEAQTNTFRYKNRNRRFEEDEED